MAWKDFELHPRDQSKLIEVRHMKYEWVEIYVKQFLISSLAIIIIYNVSLLTIYTFINRKLQHLIISYN